MRLLTKAEACRELAVSLSTLDRRIAAGEIRARRGAARTAAPGVRDAGRRPADENGEAADSALAVAQERIRGLGRAGGLAARSTGPGTAAQRRTDRRVESSTGTARTLVAVLAVVKIKAGVLKSLAALFVPGSARGNLRNRRPE